MGGAVVDSTRIRFPYLWLACLLALLSVLGGGLLLGGMERLIRSVGFLFPGELVQLHSFLNRVAQSLAKCPNPLHS